MEVDVYIRTIGACSIAILCFFFFSSRRRHTRSLCDWSSDVCSSDLLAMEDAIALKESFAETPDVAGALQRFETTRKPVIEEYQAAAYESMVWFENARDRKSVV